MPYYDISGEAGPYDLLGDLEIEGDDDMLGALASAMSRVAAKRPTAPARRPMAMATRQPAPVAQVTQVGNARVVASGPTKSKRLLLPIDTGAVAIAGGATVTIPLNSSQTFRATQMRLDPVAAPAWLITDVKIGRKSQFLGAGAVPATVFNANNPDCNVDFDTAQANEPLQLILTNNSNAPSRLTGALIGETLE
jgi:hypothetical protein